jgi:mannosyltransferase
MTDVSCCGCEGAGEPRGGDHATARRDPLLTAPTRNFMSASVGETLMSRRPLDERFGLIERSSPFIAPVSIIAAAVLLRFATIDRQSYWDDEAYTIDVMRLSFVDTFGRVREIESAPPLYYALAWIWTRVFGIGEVGLRSLSALFGTAAVVVAYVAASNLISRRAGLIAAALVATNPLLIWYSQEARAYALHVLMTSISFLFFVRAVRETGRRNLVLWAFTSALALGSFYFALFPIAVEAVWLLWRRSRAALVPVLAVASAGLLLLPLALLQSQKHFPFTDVPLVTRVAQVPEQFLVGYGVWSEPAGKLAAVIAAVLVLAAVVFLVADNAGERHGALVAGAISVSAAGIPFVLAVLGADFVSTQTVIGALVPVLIVFAGGFAARRTIGIVLAGGLCVVGITVSVAVAANPQFHRADLRGAATALGSNGGFRAIVVSPASMLRAYVPRLTDLPAGGAYVTEIAIIGMAVKEPGEKPDVPRVLPRRIPARGFVKIARVNAEKFTVIRFRSDRPTLVRPAQLVQSRLGEWPPNRVAIMLQRPVDPKRRR